MGTFLISFLSGVGFAVATLMLLKWRRRVKPAPASVEEGLPLELVEAKNHLQLIVDTMFDGLITLDAAGAVLSMNHMARKITAYSDEDIEGLMASAFLGDVLQRRGDYVDPQEGQLTRADGLAIPVELAIRVIPTARHGKLTLVTVRDISDFKKTQKLLLQQSHIIEESESFVFVADRDYRFEWCNKRFESLTGYSLAELEGLESIQSLMVESNAAAKFKAVDEAIAQHQSFKTEILLRGKTGRPYWAILNLVPLYDTDGEFEKYAGLGFDITDQKVAERMQSDFVSMVSHELRTPLTVIAGSFDALQLDRSVRAKETESLLIEMGQRNCVRLESLIEDLLDISKIENGTLSFQCENVDMVQVARRAVDDIKSLAQRANISLLLEVDTSDQIAFVDWARLTQVMSNLLSNAIKFSPEGSSVAVRVEQIGERVVTSVRDSGRGIPEDFRPMMFRRFSREASVQADGTEGFGLGLSICKQLIEQMSGEIDFESTHGEGSRFFFTLPLVHQAVEELAA